MPCLVGALMGVDFLHTHWSVGGMFDAYNNRWSIHLRYALSRQPLALLGWRGNAEHVSMCSSCVSVPMMAIKVRFLANFSMCIFLMAWSEHAEDELFWVLHSLQFSTATVRNFRHFLFIFIASLFPNYLFWYSLLAVQPKFNYCPCSLWATVFGSGRRI